MVSVPVDTQSPEKDDHHGAIDKEGKLHIYEKEGQTADGKTAYKEVPTKEMTEEQKQGLLEKLKTEDKKKQQPNDPNNPGEKMGEKKWRHHTYLLKLSIVSLYLLELWENSKDGRIITYAYAIYENQKK